MAAEVKLITEIPVVNVLGEGVVWNAEQQAFWWTDIYGQRLYRYRPTLNGEFDVDCLTYWHMPEPVGCFGFVKGSDKLMVASASGIGFWTPNDGICSLDSLAAKSSKNGLDSLAAKSSKNELDSQIAFFAKPEQDRVGNRFNDGKTDPAGRFWAGAMVEDILNSKHKAGLYRVSTSLTVQQVMVQQVMDGFYITNSLCWNEAGTKMYHADSPTDKIYCYDFDIVSGTPINKVLFAQTDGSCVPDGACTDTQGGVWVAHWQRNSGDTKVTTSKVVRYNSDGSESLTFEVPFSQCTCVGFGGPNMDLLIVTSARHGLSSDQLGKEPDAGKVLIYQTPYRGVVIPQIQSHSNIYSV